MPRPFTSEASDESFELDRRLARDASREPTRRVHTEELTERRAIRLGWAFVTTQKVDR